LKTVTENLFLLLKKWPRKAFTGAFEVFTIVGNFKLEKFMNENLLKAWL